MISIKSFTIGNFVEITIKPLGTHRLMALGFITSCHENQRILDDSSSPKDNNGDQEPIVMSATRLHWLQVINGESSIAMQCAAARGRVQASGAVEDADKGIMRRVKVLTPDTDKTLEPLLRVDVRRLRMAAHNEEILGVVDPFEASQGEHFVGSGILKP